MPRGGPDGGDGGDGGDVIVRADGSQTTLHEMGRRRMYRAGRGEHGQGGRRHGARGKDVVLGVPLGTLVSRMEDGGSLLLADLVEEGHAVIVARGGRGGWGNARFATAIRRAPRIAQRGQAGEQGILLLELKVLADVGIVGLPNVGKSTLLRAISAAQPKVADYPFTTLEPVLGVTTAGHRSFVLADIPGLVAGAHEGAGLGLDFLRHIERTRIILHLIDGSRDDPVADLAAVNSELASYGRDLSDKEQVVVVNKVDLPPVQARLPALREALRQAGTEPLFVSAALGHGTGELVQRLASLLPGRERRQAAAAAVEAVRRPSETRGLSVAKEGRAFRVDGDRVVAFAEMMPLETEEGRAEFWRRLARWGVTAALRRAGAGPGNRIRLGSVELEWPG